MVFDDRLELFDPSLHHALLVLGRVVLEVLRKVAQLAGGLDLGDDLGPAHGGQLVQLSLDRFEALRRDVNVAHLSSLTVAGPV